MTRVAENLPDFDDPPVIETVLGVEFASLESWQVPHFGLFWQLIRDDYPRIEVQPPLVSADDRRSMEERILQAVMVELLPHPPIRCWYINESRTRLLQIQNDRFIHNWRKEGKGEAYPHYETIRPIFEHEWSRFCTFLAREKVGTPQPMRCEVTYVNHLVKGREWRSLADLPRLFPTWSGATSGGFLPTPDAVTLNMRYPLPQEKGHLTVQLQPAVRRSDRQEVLQLTLTARGRPTSPAVGDLLAWFDLGREFIVRAFCDFTSPEMHRMWGRKD